MLEVYGDLRVKGKTILENIELKLEKGFYILVGPNGAGKTSLMKAITGFRGYEVNKVIFNGEDITSLPLYERAKRGIVYVYQNPPTNLNITLDDLEDALGIIVPNTLEFSDKVLFKEFSGGEAKFLDFLISYSLKPKVFLLDEIDSQLDINRIKKVAEMLNDYDGITIISTHTLKILEFLRKDKIEGFLEIKDGKLLKRER